MTAKSGTPLLHKLKYGITLYLLCFFQISVHKYNHNFENFHLMYFISGEPLATSIAVLFRVLMVTTI